MPETILTYHLMGCHGSYTPGESGVAMLEPDDLLSVVENAI